MTSSLPTLAPLLTPGPRFDEHPDLTAVVVHNEPILEPVVHAFQQAGHEVPRDLSIVAICPDEQAEHALLPLTSVAIPAEEVGERAVELLMAKLGGEDVPEATLLPPRLTARLSTAPLERQTAPPSAP